MVFKFGDEEKEISDEIMIISHQRDKLELGQFMYEFILLEVPMKKLHPRFASEEESEVGTIVYSSSSEEVEDIDEKQIDPRWEALKKLK
jgi:uncharacterized metal-binding protein YceD (DUF177 family)